MAKRNVAAWVLITGPAIWLFLFFVIPLLVMGIFSLRPDLQGNVLTLGWTPTLQNYQDVLQNPDYIRLLLASVVVAFLVALIGVTLAYPLAYFLTFRVKINRSLLLTLLILPFWTSYLLRIIAWKIILGSNGLINSLLLSLGLIKESLPILSYGRPMIVVTLLYVWLPFMALPIYAALQRIDRSLLEAASNLGAPPWMSFLRVTLPLSLPGVIASFMMVFIPTVGEYITPILVGGPKGSLYGNIIQVFFGDGLNWPVGSAMAMIMLVSVLVMLVILIGFVDLRRFVG